MRSLVSGVLGALAALVLVAAWHGRTGGDERAWAAGHEPGSAALQPAGDTPAFPVNVQCAPGQRAVVRQLATTEGAASVVECAGTQASDIVMMPAAPAVAYGPAASAPARVIPAVTTTAAAPERVVYRAPAERRNPPRNWKKTALVIGGSAGAGAGVGALAGGKKGALIGAAIGGGAASIYEAAKR